MDYKTRELLQYIVDNEGDCGTTTPRANGMSDRGEFVENCKKALSPTVYVVTEFGCNSGCNEMWTPKNYVFGSYDKAYQHYLKIRPDPNDLENIAEVNKIEGGEVTMHLNGYLS